MGTPWKINMDHNYGGLVQIIFLSKWVICMFHVNLPGCMFSFLSIWPRVQDSHVQATLSVQISGTKRWRLMPLRRRTAPFLAMPLGFSKVGSGHCSYKWICGDHIRKGEITSVYPFITYKGYNSIYNDFTRPTL